MYVDASEAEASTGICLHMYVYTSEPVQSR